MKTPRAGGAYLGVGPEQNFTYIAALQPKIAFVFDIRREMMLEHLMYKSIFEISANRVEFVANLFSRKAPAPLSPDSSVGTIFQAFERVPNDPMLAERNANATTPANEIQYSLCPASAPSEATRLSGRIVGVSDKLSTGRPDFQSTFSR